MEIDERGQILRSSCSPWLSVAVYALRLLALARSYRDHEHWMAQPISPVCSLPTLVQDFRCYRLANISRVV